MKNKIGRNKWLALFSVTLAYSFAFLTRYIWSPVMSTVGAEFRISSTQMGLYMTAFMVGYLIMQIPGGILADRLQPKYLLMVTVGVAAAGSMVFSMIDSYGLGLAVRAVEGLCCGGIYSSCSKVVSMYFERKERAVAMGILLSSPSLGILLANSFGEPLNESLGWRATIRAVAYVGLAVVVLLLVNVRTEEKSAGSTKAGLLDGAKLYLADRQQILLALSGMFAMFASVGFATWMNTYMKSDLHFSGIYGGMLLTVYSVVGIAAACVSGPLVKRFGWDPRKFLIFLFAAGAACTLAFSQLRSYLPLLCVGVLYGVVVNLPSAHLADLCIRRSPEAHIATMCALENLIFQSGGMLQSWVIGAAADGMGSYHCMWWIFTVSGVLSVVCMLLFKGDKT